MDPIERLRRIALALPGTSEKLSHGSPSFLCDAAKDPDWDEIAEIV